MPPARLARVLVQPAIDAIFLSLADLAAPSFALLHRCQSYPSRGLGPQVRLNAAIGLKCLI